MIIVRPIVNILFVIYNFVGDFGLAVILFTIIVKFLMWPLVKRQLHQAKLMKQIQPQLAEGHRPTFVQQPSQLVRPRRLFRPPWMQPETEHHVLQTPQTRARVLPPLRAYRIGKDEGARRLRLGGQLFAVLDEIQMTMHVVKRNATHRGAMPRSILKQNIVHFRPRTKTQVLQFMKDSSWQIS